MKILTKTSDMAASLNEVETFDKSVLQRLFPDISVKQKNHKDWMTDFEKEIDSYLKTLKQQSASSSDIAASLNEVETFDKSVLQRLFPDISVKQKSHKDWMTDFEKQIDSHLKTLKSSSIKSEGRILELEATVKINKEERSSLVNDLDILIVHLFHFRVK
ncbi:uncharacterized protein LOC132759671 [Ruditapes philippinarum]|uniref:uncharacterized protein LOC132759671 n=1 Tax=Ruditapes philippinarum TaxID=129788 RepID=UPI00295A8994|nr:uncharacterized protein LOC132759671 [Ruditapes philippinarum]